MKEPDVSTAFREKTGVRKIAKILARYLLLAIF